MKPIIISLIIGIFASISVSALAQTKLSVSCKDTVSLGEPIRIEYTAEDDKEFSVLPKPLNFNDCAIKLIAGPRGNSHITRTTINGKSKTHQSTSFAYTFLCGKPGKYFVPALTVTDSIGNEYIFSDEMYFYVSNDEKYRKLNDAATDKDKDGMTDDTIKNKILEMVAVVDKKKISLGDSVKCQIHLYTNLDVVSLSVLEDFEVDNVIRHKIPSDTLSEFTETIYKGVPVKALLLAEYCLRPLQEGVVKIEAGAIKATYLKRHNYNIDPLEAFFTGDDSYIGRWKDAKRDSIIHITSANIKVAQKKQHNKDTIMMTSTSTRPSVGIVLDRSASLYHTEDTLQANYYELENAFIKQYLQNFKGDCDITVFANHPYKISKEELEGYSDSIKDPNNGGSAVYDAVLSAITNRETGDIDKRAVLLLTDGSDNCSRISANTLTDILLENGIRMDVVAFASKKDSVYYFFKDSIDTNGDYVYDDASIYMKVENEQNLDKVKEIAAATGGVFVQVCNDFQLSKALQQLEEAIDRGPKTLKKPSKMFKPDKVMLTDLFKEIREESTVPL